MDNTEIKLTLSENELRLIMKLVEANDSGMLDRRGRLGGTRLRVSLAHKVYQAVDALGGDEPEEPETEPPA